MRGKPAEEHSSLHSGKTVFEKPTTEHTYRFYNEMTPECRVSPLPLSLLRLVLNLLKCRMTSSETNVELQGEDAQQLLALAQLLLPCSSSSFKLPWLPWSNREVLPGQKPQVKVEGHSAQHLHHHPQAHQHHTHAQELQECHGGGSHDGGGGPAG